jgi:hypothetical protein
MSASPTANIPSWICASPAPPPTKSAGLDGGYHIEPSGKIVFETGPLAPYFSKLVPGHRIGLNSNGDQFYATTCELNPNRR